LEPGRPLTYDEQNDRWLPAEGDRLLIRVRYPTADGFGEVDISQWMMDARTKRPIPAQRWLFCGSRRFGEGTFGADADGTVVCVVDFSTALIGLPESHSSDNALLWVTANTAEIPPIGTRCTLLIRAAEHGPMIVECLGPGRFLAQGQTLTLAELKKLVAERLAQEPDVRVTVRIPPGTAPQPTDDVVKAIRALGVQDVRTEEAAPPPKSRPSRSTDPSGTDG
ncbi:MAG TPA: YdjY domain-containing protein, partial [Phycisphaerae bacterium]|nr:YdjY domain-containing protein [Phycisphaerae bacterium]